MQVGFACLASALTFFAFMSGTVAGQEIPPAAAFYAGSKEYPLPVRAALVIGVSGLQDNIGFLPLKNPVNDAARVTTALRKIGFSVTNLSESYTPEQMTRQNIKRALYDFGLLLKETRGLGLVYFSGHGLERGGQIYLAPYDAYVRFDRDFNEELIPLSWFYDAFTYANNPLNLIIIDACRDNPWSKPIEQFGLPPTILPRANAAENVIMANSTLSGSKALDGAGQLSPYADAFVSAVQVSDGGIKDVFDTVSYEVRKLTGDHPDIQVPNYTDIGRNFVFAPTVVTFNREQFTFDTAKVTGNRDVLMRLMWNYAAGYFYKAAEKYLANAPLAPAASRAPTRIVRTVGDSNLRASPSTASALVAMKPAGERLAVIKEGAQSPSGHKWYTVDVGESFPLYIRTDRVRTVTKTPSPTKLENLSFITTSTPGLESLDAQSANQIDQLFQGNNKNLITKVEVVGYQSAGSKSGESGSLRLLARQAAVIQALSQAGFDGAKVAVTTGEASNAEELDSVDIFINRADLSGLQTAMKPPKNQ